jgi:hypothetical protein
MMTIACLSFAPLRETLSPAKAQRRKENQVPSASETIF